MSNPGKRPRIAALLVDISGNLHVGSNPTPNAVNAFHRLQKSSVPFRLCSNTSKESTGALIKRLDAMGFKVSYSQGTSAHGMESNRAPARRRLVWTSIGAVAQTITNLGLKSPFLLLSDSAREEVISGMREQGESKHPGGQEVNEAHTHDSVVVGLAPSCFDYATLNTAFRILKGETARSLISSGNTKPKTPDPAHFIATHKAKYYETESGLSLGPGPFVVALESASGAPAHVVGKPTKEFFQMVIDDFTPEELPMPTNIERPSPRTTPNPCPPTFRGKIAVIGDDVEADLGDGAVELGLWRILVKTGKYRSGDETRPGVVPPDEVFDSFAGFIDSLLSDRISEL